MNALPVFIQAYFFLVVHLDRGNGDPWDGLAEPGSRMIYKKKSNCSQTS